MDRTSLHVVSLCGVEEGSRKGVIRMEREGMGFLHVGMMPVLHVASS